MCRIIKKTQAVELQCYSGKVEIAGTWRRVGNGHNRVCPSLLSATQFCLLLWKIQLISLSNPDPASLPTLFLTRSPLGHSLVFTLLSLPQWVPIHHPWSPGLCFPVFTHCTGRMQSLPDDDHPKLQARIPKET